MSKIDVIDVREAEAGFELNKACAELLGWEVGSKDRKFDKMPVMEGGRIVNEGMEWHTECLGIPPKYRDKKYDRYGRWVYAPECWVIVWCAIRRYSERISAAWELVEAIDNREAYLVELVRVINYDNDISEDDFNLEGAGLGADWLLTHGDVWRIAHATPHQRARAFLLAHGVTEIEAGDD